MLSYFASLIARLVETPAQPRAPRFGTVAEFTAFLADNEGDYLSDLLTSEEKQTAWAAVNAGKVRVHPGGWGASEVFALL